VALKLGSERDPCYWPVSALTCGRISVGLCKGVDLIEHHPQPLA